MLCIQGKVNKWIKSFLEQRSQAVVVEGFKSDTIPVRFALESHRAQSLVPVYFKLLNDLPEYAQSKTRLTLPSTAP